MHHEILGVDVSPVHVFLDRQGVQDVPLVFKRRATLFVSQQNAGLCFGHYSAFQVFLVEDTACQIVDGRSVLFEQSHHLSVRVKVLKHDSLESHLAVVLVE